MEEESSRRDHQGIVGEENHLQETLGSCFVVVVGDDEVDMFACPVFIISTVVKRAIVFP